VAQDEAVGTVLVWNDAEGWGVIRSPDVSSDVWVHSSDVDSVDDERTLNEGDRVEFRYRSVTRADFTLRTSWVRRLA
jgi:CspA family cold shock protein